METIDKDLLLEGAINIAEDILSRAKRTPEGIYWEFMTLGENREAAWEISHSIYSGVPGIVLFYVELHKQTGDDKWMAAYRFWVKIFALSFAMGVVSGITMSFQFGTN